MFGEIKVDRESGEIVVKNELKKFNARVIGQILICDVVPFVATVSSYIIMYLQVCIFNTR